jgi:hypothetical protein
MGVEDALCVKLEVWVDDMEGDWLRPCGVALCDGAAAVLALRVALGLWVDDGVYNWLGSGRVPLCDGVALGDELKVGAMVCS